MKHHPDDQCQKCFLFWEEIVRIGMDNDECMNILDLDGSKKHLWQYHFRKYNKIWNEING